MIDPMIVHCQTCDLLMSAQVEIAQHLADCEPFREAMRRLANTMMTTTEWTFAVDGHQMPVVCARVR